MTDINHFTDLDKSPEGERHQSERETLVKETGNELFENFDVPQDLKDYREAWKEKMGWLDNETKEKIVKAAEKISVKIEKDDKDGSRVIEFKLGGKSYKILDPVLENHTDDEYKCDGGAIPKITKSYKNAVKLRGMWGDDVDGWKNKKLKENVQEKKGEGFHIAKIEEMKNILGELGKNTGLVKYESEQIAMLMYLTGMEGWYGLSMGNDSISDKNSNSRSRLECDRLQLGGFHYNYNDNNEKFAQYSSLLMISEN